MKTLANLPKRGTSGSFGVPSEKEDKKQSVDLETLDNFALEKWEVRIQVDSIFFICFPIYGSRQFCTTWYLRQNQVNNQEGPLTVFCSSYNEAAWWQVSSTCLSFNVFIMALVTEWRLEFLQLHQLVSSLSFIRPTNNCGTFYCNISISPRYLYRSVILFCKSTDRVVSGAANGFSRGLGFHIHALDHGAWKSDYFQHFSNER